MKKKLNLEEIEVSSFITKINYENIIGASNCCLRDTEAGENCYTFGHFSDCGSTGTDGDPTGMNTVVCTNITCP